MHRRTKALAFALALPLVAVGCGDDDDAGGATSSTSTSVTGSSTTAAPSTTAPADEKCTEERKGGEVTFGVLSPTRGLDPIVALGSGYAGGIELSAIFDNLLIYDPATGEFLPHVAESFESNATKDEWTITLRDGIKFGNGDPLTTEAVKFSFERMAKASVSSAGLAAEVASMELKDDRTMTFKLKAPNGNFPYTLAEDNGAIVNPAVVNAMGNEAFNLNPRGAGVGPYEVERFAPEEEIVLRAKDDYWGGPVCIERLRFVYVAGGMATYEAFEQGELQAALLAEGPAVAAALEDGTPNFESISSGNTYIVMNQGVAGYNGPVKDVRVRKAIAYAIDPHVANQRGEQGFALEGPTVIAKEAPFSPGVPGPEYDPDEARRLVNEVKAEGWDGKISLTFGNTQANVDTSIALEAMLEAVGMDVTVENLSPTDLNTKVLTQPNFELGSSGLSMQEESLYARLNQFECGSVRSRTAYCDPRMDAALKALREASTRPERVAALTDLQEVWNETIPSYVLFHRRELIIHKPELKGLVLSRDITPMFFQAYLER